MNDNDFLEEILIIYDDNTLAISLHISYLSSISKNNQTKSCLKGSGTIKSIETDLIEGNNLKQYVIYFKKIMDCSNKDIEKFIDLSELRIEGISDMLFNIRNIVESEVEVRRNIELIKNFKKDCLDINIQSQKLLEALI